MQLVECVAETLGVDRATVVNHDRNLAAVGLRTKGGRGPSAARMTARDAAHLVIAVAASDAVGRSAEAVERFAGLPVVGWRAGVPFEGLKVGHTFGDALTALIDGLGDRRTKGADGVWAEVEMVRPARRAKIAVGLGSDHAEADYQQADSGNTAPLGSLVTVARVSDVALAAIGQLLRG